MKISTKITSLLLLATLIIICSFTLVACNSNAPEYYTRAVTSSDVIVEQDTSELFSFSFIVRPQYTIRDLLIYFSFFDDDQNPILATGKALGNVNQGGEYRITLTLSEDVSLSQKLAISQYEVHYMRGSIKVEQKIKGFCSQHKFDDGVITKQATCIDAGERTLTCVKCNYKETRTMSAEEHSYITWKVIKAPTCASPGTTKFICTKCALREDKIVDPTLQHQDKNYDGKCDTCGIKMN